MWPYVIGAGVAAAGVGLWRLGAVSKGRAIPNARSGRALLIVDMQSGFLEKFPDKGEATLQRILDRADAYKARGEPVVALQHIWRTAMGVGLGIASGGAGLPASPGTALQPGIAKRADHILEKNKQDGFHKPDLDDLLAELGVGELEICGLDGVYCVRATTLAALNRGFAVRVDPDLVLSANPEKFRKMQARWQLLANEAAGP